MNRIAELRRLKGWSQSELAEKCGVVKNTILRLEKGETRLTVDWMHKLAQVFECSEADLLDMAAFAEAEDDITEADMKVYGPVASAMALKGLRVFKVTGTSVSSTGIEPGHVITVDTSPDAISGLKSGDIVLVNLSGRRQAQVLRQFVHPGMLVTNRPGNNLAVRIDDTSMNPTVLGVVIRE